MDKFGWQDGEYEYCAELIASGGNANVSHAAIPDYLMCQIFSARRDERYDVVAALQELRTAGEAIG